MLVFRYCYFWPCYWVFRFPYWVLDFVFRFLHIVLIASWSCCLIAPAWRYKTWVPHCSWSVSWTFLPMLSCPFLHTHTHWVCPTIVHTDSSIPQSHRVYFWVCHWSCHSLSWGYSSWSRILEASILDSLVFQVTSPCRILASSIDRFRLFSNAKQYLVGRFTLKQGLLCFEVTQHNDSAPWHALPDLPISSYAPSSRRFTLSLSPTIVSISYSHSPIKSVLSVDFQVSVHVVSSYSTHLTSIPELGSVSSSTDSTWRSCSLVHSTFPHSYVTTSLGFTFFESSACSHQFNGSCFPKVIVLFWFHFIMLIFSFGIWWSFIWFPYQSLIFFGITLNFSNLQVLWLWTFLLPDI